MPRGIYDRKKLKKVKEQIKNIKEMTAPKMKPFDEGYTKGFNEGYAEVTKKQDLIKRILNDVDNIVNIYEAQIKLLTTIILNSMETGKYSAIRVAQQNTEQVTGDFKDTYNAQKRS